MLSIQHLSVNFNEFALHDISFDVEPGDYFMLLGESGAGKSLVLETIAGLITPSRGALYLNGEEITRRRIQDRNIGLVFQDYAVFFHMRVRENIEYAIRGRYDKAEKRRHINEIAEKLGIVHLLERRPSTLSGGELQRVALARTLILKPQVLLLDEPLSSLDIRLRNELRKLLRSIHHEGQTIIHVTHNYEEAVSLGNKIAVIHQGRIIQTGSPDEVFQHPTNEFAAHFTGETNFFPARVIHPGETSGVPSVLASCEVLVDDRIAIRLGQTPVDENGFILIRKEEVILSRESFLSTALNVFRGRIMDIHISGRGVVILVDIGIPIHAEISRESMELFQFRKGEEVWLTFKAAGVRFIPG